ncbi:FAD-binding oxidoreductase [Flavobacteriales bacterium]|jgi:gamma-glutamylputrescine oxidase|nr:FAD-binding oxidoreductase [Flavobacteriales bacterium]
MSTVSYWERESFLEKRDYIIVGSGIVGLTCALELKQLNPQASITILEKGFLPAGASTKNAGFTCFGSPSELLDDLNHLNTEDVFKLVENRVNGLTKLRRIVGDKNMVYKEYGSYELFKDTELYHKCMDNLEYLNKQLKPIFNQNTFEVFTKPKDFGLAKESLLIKNVFEGQLNTGLMMKNLITLATKAGVEILNGFTVANIAKINEGWKVLGKQTSIETKKLILCNNAFASKLLPELDVKPARAQVLITKPIKNLKIKGCFHMDRGYYYFRNVANRVLLGGGRNLDFKAEETFEMSTSVKIQEHLKALLKTKILPNQDFEIEHSWSGIMGMGNSKTTLLKQLDESLFCAIRLGGMGVALGTDVGQKVANLANSNR